jgi:hypothetical protein
MFFSNPITQIFVNSMHKNHDKFKDVTLTKNYKIYKPGNIPFTIYIEDEWMSWINAVESISNSYLIKNKQRIEIKSMWCKNFCCYNNSKEIVAFWYFLDDLIDKFESLIGVNLEFNDILYISHMIDFFFEKISDEYLSEIVD